MLKKSATVGLAFLLATSSIAPVAFADEASDEVLEEEVSEDVQEGEKAEEGSEEEEIELVTSLSLEQALERALEDNSSLMLLNYQLEILENQEGNTNLDYRDLEKDIEDLEDALDNLMERRRNLDPFDPSYIGERIGLGQEWNAMNDQLEMLEDTIEQLEDALEQLRSGQVTLVYNQDEARESIKMATAMTFTQLLMTEEQLELQRKSIDVLETEIANLDRQRELGLISFNEFNTEARELRIQKSDLEQEEKKYHHDLAEFALDLGLVYHPDFSLEPIELSSSALPEQETDTNELIENSFQYKAQLEAIEMAKYERERVYDDEDSSSYQKNEADLNVKVEEENLAQLKLNAEAAIRQLYFDIEDSYQAIQDAQRDLDYARYDYNMLERRYQLGLMSKATFEQAAIQIDQAELAHEMAKYSYFLVTQQLKALEAGVLPQQGQS